MGTFPPSRAAGLRVLSDGLGSTECCAHATDVPEVIAGQDQSLERSDLESRRCLGPDASPYHLQGGHHLAIGVERSR